MGIGSQKLMSFLLATTALSDIVHAAAAADTFADALLTGEAEGFAIDATGVTASPAYVGAPEGGYVSIKEYDSPAALMSNVPLDDPRSPLVQSGTSPKLVRYHSDNGDSPGSDYPLMRWTPHNLCIQSQTLDNVAWTKANATISANAAAAPDGTTTADTLVEASDVAQEHSAASTTFTVVSGFVYTSSMYAKAASGSRRLVLTTIDSGDSNGVYAVFDIAGGQVGVVATAFGSGWTAGTATIESVGSGWYRCSVNYNVGNTSIKIKPTLDNASGTAAVSQTYNGNGTSGLYLWGAQACRGYNANPYLVTTTAARIGIPVEYDQTERYGILVEAAATNSVKRSEQFDDATDWPTVTQTTISANATTSPDGSSTADKLTPTTTSSAHYISSSAISYTNTVHYTISCYAKAAGYNFILINSNTSAVDYGAAFDLSNGTFYGYRTGGGTETSNSITAVGDGWYRITFSHTSTQTNAGGAVAILVADTGANAVGITSFSGDGSSGVYVWGMQIETGDVATSYIPTLGSTVTRATDAVNVATSTYPHSATEGTFVVWLRPRTTTTNQRTLNINNGTSNERMVLYNDGTPNYVFQMIDGGVDQGVADNTSATLNTTSGNKLAGFYKLNDFGCLADGGAETVDTSGTLPTVTNLQLGYAQDTASRELNGYIYQLTYVPRRMTQAEMQTRTT